MLALLVLLGLAAAEPVTFTVNDSMTKDKALEGVRIRAAGTDVGTTDESGRLTVDLPAAEWVIEYELAGYVPLRARMQVPEGGTEVVTTLAMLLEAQGLSEQQSRVQIVLNWGTGLLQARDLDAHLVLPDDHNEVYFAYPAAALGEGSYHLDVDDMDGGGPETITLVDPAPGAYRYFVENFSGSPHRLSDAGVVVRVYVGDRMLEEYTPPEGIDGAWYPFEQLVVSESGSPRIEDWGPEEVAAGLDRRGYRASGSGDWGFYLVFFAVFMGGCFILWRNR